jgi:uncharacterized HAD superfamily protein
MTIGFDLDDVLMDFRKSLHSYHNRRYSTNHQYQDCRENLSVIWNCDETEAVRRVFEFYYSAEHWDTLPVIGAVKGITQLSEGHNLFIVTAKSEEFKDQTQAWLDKYFPAKFNGLFFTNQYHGHGSKRTKGEVCQELGLQLFIDDSLHNVEDVAGYGIPALLFDAPWNQGEVTPPIIRVYSWDEIVAVLSHRLIVV